MKAMLRRHPLVGYTVLAYLGSWLLWLPIILSQQGIGILGFSFPGRADRLLNMLALFAGPFLAAVVMTRVCDGKASLLLRRLVQFRAPGIAYLVALVLIPLVVGAVSALWPAERVATPGLVPVLITALVTYPILLLLGGPLAEEPGWRGFALPRAQRRFHPAVAALVVGVIWWGWHLPQYLIKDWDTPKESVADIVGFFVFVLAMSVVISWATNLGRGSLVIAMLAHNGINWALTYGPQFTGRKPSMLAGALAAALLAGIALAVSKGRLGYRADTDTAARDDAPAPSVPDGPSQSDGRPTSA